jgi:MFS family permease
VTAYQRWLFFFLVATFFEGYGLFALAQILPNLRADMGLTTAYAGLLVSITSVGNVLAYLNRVPGGPLGAPPGADDH